MTVNSINRPDYGLLFHHRRALRVAAFNIAAATLGTFCITSVWQFIETQDWSYLPMFLMIAAGVSGGVGLLMGSLATLWTAPLLKRRPMGRSFFTLALAWLIGPALGVLALPLMTQVLQPSPAASLSEVLTPIVIALCTGTALAVVPAHLLIAARIAEFPSVPFCPKCMYERTDAQSQSKCPECASVLPPRVI